MWVSSLEVGDFRNLATISINPTRGLNLISGQNAQGKTNLLEALGVVLSGVSFRGAGYDSMVRNGLGAGFVRARVATRAYETDIAAVLDLGARRALRMKMANQPVLRARDLLEVARVTVFTPDDLGLVRGGPSLRRTFLDSVAIQLKPASELVVQGFDKALRQRNALLRQLPSRPSADDLHSLDIWDERLSVTGEELLRLRRSVVETLLRPAQELNRRIAPHAPAINLSYLASWERQGLQNALVASRSDDLRRGITTTGPHRDELEVKLGDLVIRSHGSQGEARTASLALKIAAHHTVREAFGESPVLILDDVLSELDPERATELFRLVDENEQTFVSTAYDLPETMRPSKRFWVSSGSVAQA